MEDKIMSILKTRGPSLPSDIARQLNTNTVFAGAHLSTLVQASKVNISNIRIGSSPLYYIPEQKNRLEDFVRYLGEKDKRTFDLLKLKKVLRDKEQDQFTRVSLRGIKDFAVQLNVTVDGNREIFWKFYSVKDDETNQLVRGVLESTLKTEYDTKEIKKEEIVKEKPEIKLQIKKEEKQLSKPEPKKVKQKVEVIQKQSIQENFVKEEPKPDTQLQLVKGGFYNSIELSLGRKGIKIQSAEMAQKDKEYDFIIKLPSPAGDLTYYCKAKEKKRINEGDLSSAVLKAQSKRLPALFLTDGDLTKKAEKFLNEELKDQIKVMKI